MDGRPKQNRIRKVGATNRMHDHGGPWKIKMHDHGGLEKNEMHDHGGLEKNEMHDHGGPKILQVPPPHTFLNGIALIKWT